MDTISNLVLGASVAFTGTNLLFAVAGTIVGMLVGVLPGLGPAAATALLLPLTFGLSPTGAIIMLAAIYYGSQFGGTITSVLLNVPGEASSAVTCLDGHPMAKQGRAGSALTIAALGSVMGGVVATICLIVAAPFLTRVGLKLGPPEQFALMVFALSLLLALAGDSMIKAMIMGILGLLLGTIGLDPTEGFPRFTFGMSELFDGLSFVPVVMGLFGLADILISIENRLALRNISRVESVLPTRSDLRRSVFPAVRGTVLGSLLGLVPGMMPSVSAFLSYASERALSKTPQEFGKGAVEGVAGPETANNAHATAALIPLLSLGIPTTPTIAVILGAFLAHGLIPGPLLFRDHPDVVWAVITSFFIGNVILLLWNIPFMRVWIAILKVPQDIMACMIVVFMLIGCYAEANSLFGVAILLVSGVCGYVFKKLDFPVAPLILALVVGPLMERSLIQSLEMFNGRGLEILTRPVVIALLVVALAAVGFILASRRSGARFASDDGE